MKRPSQYTEGLYLDQSSVGTDFLARLKEHPRLKHLSDTDWTFIAGAHDIATKAHTWQQRYSQLPYITHPEGSVWIYLEEIIESESSPTALDVAAILCHDVIEDCPDFREILYKYSRELFWEVATQSEISKPEVLTYLTQKKSEESLTTFIHPSVWYLLRFSDDVNLLMQRIATFTGHIFYDPSFASRFPIWSKEQLLTIQISTLSGGETERKWADRVYNLRDKWFFPDGKILGFARTIDFTRRLLIPHSKWLHLHQVSSLLETELVHAEAKLRELQKAN